MLHREEEVEVEVRREDQMRINEFGRNNALLAETRDEIQRKKEKIVNLEDASTELMMGDGDNVKILIGESFVECTEEYGTGYLDDQIEFTKDEFQKLVEKEEALELRQSELKTELYGRFGSSINLEDK